MKNESSNYDHDDFLVPKSRKGVELGSGEIPSHFGLYDYNQYIWDCNITKEMYRSLSYYAARFNWENRSPCIASMQRMANDIKLNRKYLKKPLEDLQKYGWVKVQKGKKNVYYVTPLIGREVPGEKWKEPEHKKTQLLRDNGIDEEYPEISFDTPSWDV